MFGEVGTVGAVVQVEHRDVLDLRRILEMPVDVIYSINHDRVAVSLTS